ncbi:MAG: hypothetical protein Q9201_001844, partial [Fulgogasparrea decipioides]
MSAFSTICEIPAYALGGSYKKMIARTIIIRNDPAADVCTECADQGQACYRSEMHVLCAWCMASGKEIGECCIPREPTAPASHVNVEKEEEVNVKPTLYTSPFPRYALGSNYKKGFARTIIAHNPLASSSPCTHCASRQQPCYRSAYHTNYAFCIAEDSECRTLKSEGRAKVDLNRLPSTFHDEARMIAGKQEADTCAKIWGGYPGDIFQGLRSAIRDEARMIAEKQGRDVDIRARIWSGHPGDAVNKKRKVSTLSRHPTATATTTPRAVIDLTGNDDDEYEN